MEYLNNLADIPTTTKTIIEQGAIKFIHNYLKEENKVIYLIFSKLTIIIYEIIQESKKIHLIEDEGLEEHVYNLAEGNEEIED